VFTEKEKGMSTSTVATYRWFYAVSIHDAHCRILSGDCESLYSLYILYSR
jgi:hypothetical protein